MPKDDSGLLELSNWRPIPLLNLNYKIAPKVIAKRIENILCNESKPECKHAKYLTMHNSLLDSAILHSDQMLDSSFLQIRY